MADLRPFSTAESVFRFFSIEGWWEGLQGRWTSMVIFTTSAREASIKMTIFLFDFFDGPKMVLLFDIGSAMFDMQRNQADIYNMWWLSLVQLSMILLNPTSIAPTERNIWNWWEHVSHEKRAPGWLGFIGDYTIQLYGDYNKPIIRIPIKQPV